MYSIHAGCPVMFHKATFARQYHENKRKLRLAYILYFTVNPESKAFDYLALRAKGSYFQGG